MTTGTPPRFTQLSRWSPVIDPRNGEDGPPTNQVAYRTPFIPLLPNGRNAKLTPLHPLPMEYTFPPTTHGIPYWTVRVCITCSNETPQSLPLISLTSPNLPYINGCQLALCLLVAFTIRTLPCHINMW